MEPDCRIMEQMQEAASSSLDAVQDSTEYAAPERALQEDVPPEAAVEPLTTTPAEPESEAEAQANTAAEPASEAEATAEPSEGAEVEKLEDGREWYVIHSYSGYENKVRQNLEQRIDSMNMRDKIFKVVVPTEEEIEIKEGHRRKTKKRVFPGYVLVQMILDEESWYVVRNTPGVTGFVGTGTKPTALRSREVDKIFQRMEMEAPKIKVSFREGQSVRIVDGPFTDFVGTVEELNLEKGKVRVLVSFFGRETPVELDFLQVQKQ